MTVRWPAARVTLAPGEGAGSILTKVRQALKDSGAPPWLVGEATDDILLAGREGTANVAARWVRTGPPTDIDALLEELI